MEAQDSLILINIGKILKNDSRPRYFFCHLGPPYENDAIAIRQGSKKVIVKVALLNHGLKMDQKGPRMPLYFTI